MGILKFIVYLTVIQFVFDYVANFIVSTTSFLLYSMRISIFGVLLKFIAEFLIVSITVIFIKNETLDKGLFLTIIYFFIGGIFLLINLSYKTMSNIKNAKETQNYLVADSIEYYLKFDTFITFVSLLLFAIASFNPIICDYSLITKIIDSIFWVLNIKILGTIIILIGLILALANIFTIVMITMVNLPNFNFFKRKNNF